MLSWCVAKPASTLPATRLFRFIKSQPVREANRPAARIGQKAFRFGCPLRTSRRLASPTRKGKRNRGGCVRVVGRFVTACYAHGLFVKNKDGFLGWQFWLVGRAAEPLPLRRAIERLNLTLGRSSCRAGQRGDAPRIACLFSLRRVVRCDVVPLGISLFVERPHPHSVKSSPS